MVNQNNNANAPDYLHEFMERYDRMRRVTDTQELEASRFFADAARAHIMVDGLIDYKQLNSDPNSRLAMAADIGDSMAARASEYHMSGAGLSWDAQALQTYGLFGTTGGRLKAQFERLREDFTISQMANDATQHKRTLFEVLAPSTYEHIPDTPAAIGSLITGMGLTGKIDPTRARLNDLVDLLIGYAGNSGTIPQRALERSPAYIPPAVPHV